MFHSCIEKGGNIMEQQTLYLDAPADPAGAKEVITWTLDFINSDLGSMDQTQQWKLALDLQRYLVIRIYTDGSKPAPDLGVRLINVQKALREFFDQFLRPALEGKDPVKFPPAPSERFTIASTEAFFFVLNDKLAFVSAGSPDIGTEAKHHFINALRAMSPRRSDFQKCQGCSRYFFQGARKRRFCTHLCNLRFNAEERRGEKGSAKREKYNKAQRKLMKKRYRDKKKRGLGE